MIFSRLKQSAAITHTHVCTFRLSRLARCNKQEPSNHFCTRERTRYNTSDRAWGMRAGSVSLSLPSPVRRFASVGFCVVNTLC